MKLSTRPENFVGVVARKLSNVALAFSTLNFIRDVSLVLEFGQIGGDAARLDARELGIGGAL